MLVEARPHSVKATGQLLEGSGPEPVWPLLALDSSWPLVGFDAHGGRPDLQISNIRSQTLTTPLSLRANIKPEEPYLKLVII